VINWNQLPTKYMSSPKPTGPMGGVALVAGSALHRQNRLGWNNYLGLMTFSFLCLLVSGRFCFSASEPLN